MSEIDTAKNNSLRQNYLTAEFTNVTPVDTKINDNRQILFTMKSRESSLTPTTFTDRPSTSCSQVQYNTSKLFQKKKAQSKVAETPKESEGKGFFQKFKPASKISDLTEESDNLKNMSSSFVETAK